jgi:Uma2 family endonuclease
MSAVLSPSVELEPSPLQALPEALEGDGEPRAWKWTGDDLTRLCDAGVLPLDRKFELLDGEIFEAMPSSPLHDTLAEAIALLLGKLAWDPPAFARQEKGLRLGPQYEPRPDVSVIRGSRKDYRSRFPEPEDILLAVEVSERTLRFDRTQKLVAYAAARIPEYWIVNVQRNQLEVYLEPDGEQYLAIRVYKPDDSVTPVSAPAAVVHVSELFDVD